MERSGPGSRIASAPPSRQSSRWPFLSSREAPGRFAGASLIYRRGSGGPQGQPSFVIAKELRRRQLPRRRAGSRSKTSVTSAWPRETNRSPAARSTSASPGSGGWGSSSSTAGAGTRYPSRRPSSRQRSGRPGTNSGIVDNRHSCVTGAVGGKALRRRACCGPHCQARIVVDKSLKHKTGWKAHLGFLFRERHLGHICRSTFPTSSEGPLSFRGPVPLFSIVAIVLPRVRLSVEPIPPLAP